MGYADIPIAASATDAGTRASGRTLRDGAAWSVSLDARRSDVGDDALVPLLTALYDVVAREGA
jgi:hypothetical protein